MRGRSVTVGVLGAVAATALAACSPADRAVLDIASLTISPCDEREPKTFAPFHKDFSFVMSFRSDDQPPWILHMRAGERVATESDALVLQFADVQALRQALDASADRTVAIDGTNVRLSMVLQQSCPDATQTLEARSGTIRLDRFDPSGGAAGLAIFDLGDRRLPDDPPLATGARLDFDVTVRGSRPYQLFTARP